MKREMGSGLKLDQIRGMMKSGRWHWSISCWPYKGRWVLAVSPKRDRNVPYHFLETEKSGQPRAMTAETALRIAEGLTVEGIYFNRREFESFLKPKPWLDVRES